MGPRPILKRSPAFQPNNHPPERHVVHFPPSSLLARTIEVPTYDRSPIIVTPNHCALPERGCPGRTYYSSDPRIPPPLVPDLSSESEESDNFTPPRFAPELLRYPPPPPSFYDARYPPYPVPIPPQPHARRPRRPSPVKAVPLDEEVDAGYVEDYDIPIASQRRKRSPRRSSPNAISKRPGQLSFQERDDGCLGGF